jgi:hypothetical protein
MLFLPEIKAAFCALPAEITTVQSDTDSFNRFAEWTDWRDIVHVRLSVSSIVPRAAGSAR